MNQEAEQEKKYREEFNLGLHPSSTFDIYLAGRKAGQEEVDRLRAENEKLKAENKCLRDRNVELVCENERLKGAMIVPHIEALTENEKALVWESKKEITRLKAENDSLKEKYKSASENVTRLGDMCNDWKRQYDELESKLRIAEMERVPVEIYDELKAEIERLNEIVDTRDKAFSLAHKEITRLKDLIRRLKSTVLYFDNKYLEDHLELIEEADKEIGVTKNS